MESPDNVLTRFSSNDPDGLEVSHFLAVHGRAFGGRSHLEQALLEPEEVNTLIELCAERLSVSPVVWPNDAKDAYLFSDGARILLHRNSFWSGPVRVIAVLPTEMLDTWNGILAGVRHRHPHQVEETEPPIHVLFFSRDSDGNLDVDKIVMHPSDLEHLDQSFYPRIDIPKMGEAYYGSSEQILMLFGAPGTGKTCLLKMFMRDLALRKNDATTVAYVKDEELLRSNDLWSKLNSLNFDLLVFDDLDNSLYPRSEQSNPFVNQLLSYSDGVFTDPAKTIITTNREQTEIDPALVRPGRCFDILDMPRLTRDEATQVWADYNLPVELYEERIGDRDEVSQAWLMSEIETAKESLPRDYLDDQTISVRTEYLA